MIGLRRRRTARRSALAVAAAAALATGCVSSAAYRDVVAERDELARRLEAQHQSYAGERDRLYAELETLRQEHEAQARELEALRRERDALAAREREQAERLGALAPTYEGLVRDLEADLAAARIEIDRIREGLRMSLPAEVLFASGSAELTAEGERVLARIAADLRDEPYQVLVQGHTDDVAIRGALAERYPTNWELAGARAARVVRVLEAQGVDPTRLAAVSLGPHHPVASNETPEGRAENRRIELRLIPLPGSRPGAVPRGFEAPAAGAGPGAGATPPPGGA